MQLKYRAVLIKRINYGDKSLVLQTFTREEGAVSFFLRSLKSKSRGNIALSPLCFLDIVATRKFGAMPAIKEIKLEGVHHEILADMPKASVVIFLNEVLQRTIGQHDQDEALFDFLRMAMDQLNALKIGLSDFHLRVLIELTRFFGFYPNSAKQGDCFFDLYEGVFCLHRPIHGQILEPELAAKFRNMLESGFGNSKTVLNRIERNQLLNALIDYYKIHVDQFDELKSREVLETVFN